MFILWEDLTSFILKSLDKITSLNNEQGLTYKDLRWGTKL